LKRQGRLAKPLYFHETGVIRPDVDTATLSSVLIDLLQAGANITNSEPDPDTGAVTSWPCCPTGRKSGPRVRLYSCIEDFSEGGGAPSA
jgi:hypothetical protein